MLSIVKLSFLLALVGKVTHVLAKDVFYNWTLNSVIDSAYSPDCMNTKDQRRSMFLAEKKFPGPSIEADEGDRIIVNITNANPSVSASIHFHGIHQMGTPYADGASFITQCALGPMQSQIYTFDAYPPGTHYWHDHASYNFADGVTGPIIIKPKVPPPYTYDEEITIFLQDWYIQTGMQQYDGLNSWPFVWVGNPNSLLINGNGIAPQCTDPNNTASYNNSMLCLPTCLGDPLNLLTIINVTAGKTYRLRLINAGQLVMMNFAIAGHNLTIVEVEGTVVDPVEVTSLDIANGQRYDVLLKTSTDQSSNSYYIETTVRERNIPVKGQAILYYTDSGENASMPLFPPVHPSWNDTAFGINQDSIIKTSNVSMHPTYTALNATNITRYVVVGTQNQILVDGLPVKLRWAMNNISNDHSSNPLINKAIDTARSLGWPADITDTVGVPQTPPFVWNYTQNVTDTSTGGPGVELGTLKESVMSFTKGQVVEIVLQNARAINYAAEFHPWHLHGHSFWVVGTGQGVYDEATDVAKYNLVNPILRDTVVLQPLGWTAVRFITDNPGAWLFHCHILAHHVMGMGFSVIVQPDQLGAAPENVEYCDNQGLAASNATGPGPSPGPDADGSSNNATGSSGSNQMNTFGNKWFMPTVIVLIISSIM